jgi:hypothetical protein
MGGGHGEAAGTGIHPASPRQTETENGQRAAERGGESVNSGCPFILSRNGNLYEFTNDRGERVWIREDFPVTYPDGGHQGPHFNSRCGGLNSQREMNLPNHHYWGDTDVPPGMSEAEVPINWWGRL